MSLTKQFMMPMALEEMPVSGWTCFITLYTGLVCAGSGSVGGGLIFGGTAGVCAEEVLVNLNDVIWFHQNPTRWRTS
ncbi:hypothetical protein EYF80_043145 [Liparis tanakae]|uniref:Uncharacterized protein n=1 Tax=Liparis tanakae TaxID=230148 RepID=A0A4Z2FZD0_9TELE|nr:hypothetical protein EYF80_043145 [Liparis tanakae]